MPTDLHLCALIARLHATWTTPDHAAAWAAFLRALHHESPHMPAWTGLARDLQAYRSGDPTEPLCIHVHGPTLLVSPCPAAAPPERPITRAQLGRLTHPDADAALNLALHVEHLAHLSLADVCAALYPALPPTRPPHWHDQPIRALRDTIGVLIMRADTHDDAITRARLRAIVNDTLPQMLWLHANPAEAVRETRSALSRVTPPWGRTLLAS